MEWLIKRRAHARDAVVRARQALIVLASKNVEFITSIVAGFFLVQIIGWVTWVVQWSDMPPTFAAQEDHWLKFSETLRNFVLVAVGIVAGTGGLYLAFVRTFALRRQSLAASEQSKSAELQVELTTKRNNEERRSAKVQADLARKKHDIDRFSLAVEQLGHAQIPVRLGAIYTLEQIAKESGDNYHWPTMETLTAFVRVGSAGRTDTTVQGSNEANRSDDQNDPATEQITADISAAMAVLVRRDTTKDTKGQPLDLDDAHLNGLSLVNVTPRNLKGAQLWRANLANANMMKVDLSGAFLEGANLTEAVLRSADLHGARLEDAILTEADLRECNLAGAGLKEANLTKADLRDANLAGAGLKKVNLTEADLRKANLSGTNLSEADLKNANLDGANLVRSNVLPLQLAEALNPTEAKLSPRLRTKLVALLAEKT